VLTDNRNRTTAEIKNIFSRNGGSMAEPGSVAWQFERKGLVILEHDVAEEDDLMLAALEAGAEDISTPATPGWSPPAQPTSTRCAPRSTARGSRSPAPT